MAEALKIEGNAHVAAKEWEKAVECYSQALELVKESDNKQKAVLLSNRSWCLTNLNRLKEAVEDGQLCIKLQPNWSKSYLRCGQAYSKQCNYAYAKLVYSAAIRTAETSTIKASYVAAREAVQQSEALQQGTSCVPTSVRALDQKYHQTWIQRVMDAKTQGYQLHDGAISMMIDGWNMAANAWAELDKALFKKDGLIMGAPASLVNQQLAECILIDHLSFAIPNSEIGTWSYRDRFFALTGFQITNMPSINRYFIGRRFTAEEIIADLEGQRRRGSDWSSNRTAASILIRGAVLLAFINSSSKKHAEAIIELELAIAIIEKGNQTWSDVSWEDKGSSFKPTFYRMMRAQLLHYRVEANQMAWTDSAITAFSLEAIEGLARDLISDYVASKARRNAEGLRISRLSTHVMPAAHAHAALGYAASRRAQAPLNLLEFKVGTAVLADLENAKKAARCYDLAFKLLPDDHYLKPSIGFKALEQHLYAGGKTVKDVFRLAEEAEKIRKDLVRFFVHLDEEDPARTFVQGRVHGLRDWLKSPSTQPLNGVAPINLVLKAAPTLNIGWNNETIDVNSILTPEFWSKLPGDVGLVIKVQLNAIIDGRTFCFPSIARESYLPEFDQSTRPRTFVETQVQSLRDWLAAARPPTGVVPRDQAVKAVPTLNMPGTSSTFDPNTVLDADFWNALPGEVAVADVLGLDREIRGRYA